MFHQLLNSWDCCKAHLEITEPDALGYQFVPLECNDRKDCKDKNFCLKLKRVLEETINRRNKIKEILAKQNASGY